MACARWMFTPAKLTQKVIWCRAHCHYCRRSWNFTIEQRAGYSHLARWRYASICTLWKFFIALDGKGTQGRPRTLIAIADGTLRLSPNQCRQTLASFKCANTSQSQRAALVIGRITNYVGVMNYLGGKMLTSPDALAPVFDDLAARGLMFVDDGSIRSSMAKNLSKPANLPFARAHITIDATRTRAYIQKQLQNLEIQAKRSGLAIGVATAFPIPLRKLASS